MAEHDPPSPDLHVSSPSPAVENRPAAFRLPQELLENIVTETDDTSVLRAFALTCKALFLPAITVLWRTVNQARFMWLVQSVFELYLPGSWTYSLIVERLGRFDRLYAPSIRHLSLDLRDEDHGLKRWLAREVADSHSDFEVEERERPERLVEHNVVDRLRALAQLHPARQQPRALSLSIHPARPRALFPLIKTFFMAVAEPRTLDIVTLFMGDFLLDITVQIDSTAFKTSNEKIWGTALQNMLKQLPLHSPALRAINIEMDNHNVPPEVGQLQSSALDLYSSGLVDAALALPKLLRISSCFAISSGSLQLLSRHPSLEYLSTHMCTLPPPRSPLVSFPSYTALKFLTAQWDARSMTALFEINYPTLVQAFLRIDTGRPMELSHLIDAMGRNCASLVDVSLTVHAVYRQGSCISWRELRGLLLCHRIETFHCSLMNWASVTLDDADLLSMGLAWPALTDISLWFHQSKSTPANTGVFDTRMTLAGITSLWVHCPILQALQFHSLTVDCTIVPPAPSRPYSTMPVTLDLCSGPIESSEAVATFLTSCQSNLTLHCFVACNDDYGKLWKEVQSRLEAMGT